MAADAAAPPPHRALRHQVRARWGDCDPAGIAFTPNILGYAMEAVELWFQRLTGESWIGLKESRHLLTPTVHASMDFLSPIRPGTEVELRLDVEKVGSSTIHFAITGHEGERSLFRCRIVSCFVDGMLGGAVAIPADLKAALADGGL